MSSKPPFFRQGRSDTCALACLRMLLAQHGLQVSEDELLLAAIMEPGGVHIEELARLAGHYGLQPQIQRLQLNAMKDLVAQEIFPIVFLNRMPLDQEFAIHTVIPIRFSPRFVTVLDPLRGERRITIRKFEAARRWLTEWAVVCRPV
jgi:ABC-type bacteriocin/lantibiotic exporter with double-glycine peptidase domain